MSIKYKKSHLSEQFHTYWLSPCPLLSMYFSADLKLYSIWVFKERGQTLEIIYMAGLQTIDPAISQET